MYVSSNRNSGVPSRFAIFTTLCGSSLKYAVLTSRPAMPWFISASSELATSWLSPRA